MNGGRINVYNGGRATNASAGYNGSVTVSNGVASNTYIYSGGKAAALAYGVLSGGVISSGGKMNIDSAGSAVGTYLNGGSGYIGNGGRGYSLDIYNGGTLGVANGGLISNTYVSRGTLNLYGKANYTSVFSGGTANVSGAGSMYGVTLYNSGTLNVSNGAVVNTLNYGGSGVATVYADGRINNATVNSNGIFVVSSGGSTTNVTLKNGGAMGIAPGGYASSVTISSGGLLMPLGGTCSNISLLYGGYLTVESGIRLNSLNARGTIIVSNGGVASGCKPISGGAIEVLAGGSAANTQMYTNGRMYVYSNGRVTDTVTSYGARIHVSGGSIYDTHMQRGTITSVYQGGSAYYNRVDYGSYLMIGFSAPYCSGTASSYDTVVSSGGGLTVMSGAMANSNEIYGTLTCNNGGTLLGETVIHGRANLAGEAIVTSNTAITFDVSGRAASAMQESYREAMLNSYYVAREADMTISVSADQASGSYILANWALEAKKGTFTLMVEDSYAGTFSTSESLTYNGKTYSLYCFDDATNSKALTLKVCDVTGDDWTNLGTEDSVDEMLVSDGTELYASEDLLSDHLSSSDQLTSLADYNNGSDDLLALSTATDQMTGWLNGESAYGALAIA